MHNRDWSIVELTCAQLTPTVYEPIKGIKAPKAQQEALMWINSAILDFGIEGLQLKDLVECIKQGLGNSAQPVRTTAIAIIATLATFMGLGRFCKDPREVRIQMDG